MAYKSLMRKFKTLWERGKRQNDVLMFIKDKLKEISPHLKKIKPFVRKKKGRLKKK